MTVPSPPQDSSASYQTQQNQKPSQVFEFTKRKKWSNILLAEQPDTIILVVDYERQIQYVGPGMPEALGWGVEELIETDLLDIVNNDDRLGLNDRVKSCLDSEKLVEMSCFTRLKCKHASNFPASGAMQAHKELLFEFRGRRVPDCAGSHEKLVILTAKPYPSRNTAILNTFLELTIENERLNERITSLKLEQQQLDAAASLLPQPSSSNPSSASSNHPSYPPYTSLGNFDASDALPSQNRSSTKSSSSKDVDGAGPSANVKEEDGDGSKRKKPKKAPAGQAQYVCVTCGRTDSPEWRKGPKGPKTLCNACGLRWAKRAKRPDGSPRSSSGGKEGGYIPRGSSETGGRSGKIVPVAHAQLRVTPPDPPAASSSYSTQPSSSTATSASQQQMPHPFPGPSPAHATFNHAGMVSYTNAPASIQYQHQLPISNAMSVVNPSTAPSQSYTQSPQAPYNPYGTYSWTHTEKHGEGQNPYGY